MMTVSDIIPGTDRSMPPCCTTSVCPIAAIARIAATGSIPSNEEWLTLSGCRILLTMKSATVATQITVVSPPKKRRADRLELLASGWRAPGPAIGPTGATVAALSLPGLCSVAGIPLAATSAPHRRRVKDYYTVGPDCQVTTHSP